MMLLIYVYTDAANIGYVILILHIILMHALQQQTTAIKQLAIQYLHILATCNAVLYAEFSNLESMRVTV